MQLEQYIQPIVFILSILPILYYVIKNFKPKSNITILSKIKYKNILSLLYILILVAFLLLSIDTNMPASNIINILLLVCSIILIQLIHTGINKNHLLTLSKNYRLSQINAVTIKDTKKTIKVTYEILNTNKKIKHLYSIKNKELLLHLLSENINQDKIYIK